MDVECSNMDTRWGMRVQADHHAVRHAREDPAKNRRRHDMSSISGMRVKKSNPHDGSSQLPIVEFFEFFLRLRYEAVANNHHPSLASIKVMANIWCGGAPIAGITYYCQRCVGRPPRFLLYLSTATTDETANYVPALDGPSDTFRTLTACRRINNKQYQMSPTSCNRLTACLVA